MKEAALEAFGTIIIMKYYPSTEEIELAAKIKNANGIERTLNLLERNQMKFIEMFKNYIIDTEDLITLILTYFRTPKDDLKNVIEKYNKDKEAYYKRFYENTIFDLSLKENTIKYREYWNRDISFINLLDDIIPTVEITFFEG